MSWRTVVRARFRAPLEVILVCRPSILSFAFPMPGVVERISQDADAPTGSANEGQRARKVQMMRRAFISR